MRIKCINNIDGKKMALPLEEVVELLLPLQIDTGFHIESLKAQAVIIRTNILRQSKYLGGMENIDIDREALAACQDQEKLHRATQATRGIVILYKDRPIDGKYHRSCGGSTENVENVLGNTVVYLRRVLCDYCKDSPLLDGEKTLSLEEIERKLGINLPRTEEDKEIEILNIIDHIERDKENRVLSLRIGGKNYKGYELMKLLNLDSTRFKILPGNIKFITRGYGHGLGYCQYGGHRMGQLGKNYREILDYYYTGVEIREFPLPCIDRPIYGKIIVVDPGHGGEDIGHKGGGLGLEEKQLTLDLARILKSKLEKKGATVHLTRDRDEKVIIKERIENANEIHPDFFLSIHLDYYPNSTKEGIEIYYFQDDREAKKLGQEILKRLDQASIPTRGIRQGNFYVFRGIKSSSLLMELGYLSNLEEEIRLSDGKYLLEIAEAMEKGIVAYFAR